MTRLDGVRLAWGVVLAVSLAQGALAASPIPAFPREGTVTVQDVPDGFGKLRALLGEHRSPAGAKYHVAVVAFSDPLNREGPAFGDESGAYLASVVEAWRPRVDTENAVIILLGLRNREVRVHPGSRWVRLGWEGYAVVKTLKAARFDSFARASDYDTGMKELVLAIDAELATRLKAREARVADRLKAEADALQRDLVKTRDLIASANAGILSFESRVKQSRYVPPVAREAHARAVSAVTGAQSALGEADARKALDLAERAVSDTAQAARLHTEFEALATATGTRQRELQARAAALERALVEIPFNVSPERARLKSATLALQEAETLLADHAPAEAASRLTNAEALLQDAETGLVGARQGHEFQTRTLPRFAAGVAALALLAGLGLQLRRSARRKREAQALIQHWQTLLGQVASNLLKLEDEHKLFLGRSDLVERFDGATAGPVQAAAREVDSLFLSYDAAQQVLDAAKKELAQGGPLPWLRERPYQRAISRLTGEEVVVGTEDVASHKLYLPDHREVRLTAQALMAKMQSSWERALRLVEALDTPSRTTWETLDRLKEELGTLEPVEGRLAELDVPSPLRDETAKLEPQLLALQEKARRDPLGAAEETQAFAPRLSTLLARTRRLEQAASQLQGEVRQRREEAKEALVLLGGEGPALTEPGSESDAMLRDIARLSVEALSAVRAGRDEEAVAKSSEAAARTSALLELCERASRPREELMGRVSMLEDRVRSLRERLPARRERLRGPRQSHSDPALDNTEEVTVIINRVAKSLSRARTFMAPHMRRYLAGTELLDRAVQQLDTVEARCQELELQETRLKLARQTTEKTLTTMARTLAEARGGLVEHEHRKLEKKLSELRGEAAGKRPDWPNLQQRATVLDEEISAELALGRYGVGTQPKAHSFMKALTTWRDTYASILGRNPQEHQATLALLQTVSQQLDDAVLRSQHPTPPWARIMVDLQTAAKGVEAVSKGAKEGVPVTLDARLALTVADETLHEVKTALALDRR